MKGFPKSSFRAPGIHSDRGSVEGDTGRHGLAVGDHAEKGRFRILEAVLEEAFEVEAEAVGKAVVQRCAGKHHAEFGRAEGEGDLLAFLDRPFDTFDAARLFKGVLRAGLVTSSAATAPSLTAASAPDASLAALAALATLATLATAPARAGAPGTALTAGAVPTAAPTGAPDAAIATADPRRAAIRILYALAAAGEADREGREEEEAQK